MTLRSLSEAPPREKAIKLALVLLILLCAAICFPKNYKIAVQNYQADRKEMVVLRDMSTGREKEAWYVFQRGYYYVSGIAGGTVDELLILNDINQIDDVTAYYGSIKIGQAQSVTPFLGLDQGPAALAVMAYSGGKRALALALYVLLFAAASAAGVFAVINSRIGAPRTKQPGRQLRIDPGDIVLFLGLSAFYSAIAFAADRGALIKKIYPLEICFAAVVLFLALLAVKQCSGGRWLSAAASLPVYACLYLSVSKICAFTFVDGDQAISEQVNIATDSLRHFQKNSARLNYMIMGAFERYNPVEKLSGPTPAKVLHWFFGACLLVYLTWFVVTRLLPGAGDERQAGAEPSMVKDRQAGAEPSMAEGRQAKAARALQFTALFCMVFTFNYTLEALKNYNYDLFSLTFGAIAFAHFLYGAATKRPRDAAGALAWATFGTLEKPIVWPIMLLCMLEYALLTARERGERPYLQGALGTVKAGLITIACSAGANLWIQHIVRWDDFPAYTVCNLIRPLQGMMANLVRHVYGGFDVEGTALYVLGFGASLALVYLGFVVLYSLGRVYEGQRAAVVKTAYVVFARAVSAIAFAMVVLTVLQRNFSFAKGNLKKILKYTGYSLGALPTAILIGVAGAFIICLVAECDRNLVLLVSLFALAVPVMYIFLSNSMTGRYFNLFGLCTIICVFLFYAQGGKWYSRLCQKGFMKGAPLAGRAGICLAMLVFSAVEVGAFAPAHLFYFPLWDRGREGMVLSSAVSVERQTAGEALLSYYHENGLDAEGVEMYVNYGGQWTAKPKSWKVSTFPADSLKELGSVTFDDISFGEDVYYVFTSRSVKTKRYPMYPLPDEGIEPFMTLTRRGAIEGWIYRSEDLRPYFEAVFFPNEDEGGSQ